MNKFVNLTRYHNLRISELSALADNEEVDELLFDRYGIKCIDDHLVYEVIDHSKFSLFMLKYSEHIKGIWNA
jgi:hypothetical protein